MISDTGTLMSRYCNGVWAGHMCFCVHFCGVLVCIWEHFYVHLGGVFVGIYGCFVCILVNFYFIGIQILHNIRLWHHVAYIFAARMAEYISVFRYILNKWCNKCVNGPSRPYKAKKNNNCICDLKCGQITLQHFLNLRFISTPPFSNRFVFD